MRQPMAVYFPQWKVTMAKYLIERHMPGAGSLTENELEVLSEKSCRALAELGSQIQWVESFITADRVYSIYIAQNERLIHQHASLSGLPADSICEVKAVIDPSTSWRRHWNEEHDVSKESGIY
jgi:hypothetical protein